jgi:AcrR family transcriptional regulator
LTTWVQHVNLVRVPTPSSASAIPADAEDDPRRRALLDAAAAVFMRFGYRKASMVEVARAAQISRQGLYLHFATKEELFRAAVRRLLDAGLRAAGEALGDPRLTIEAKLVAAFDQWVGRHVGKMGAGASDLVEATASLVGPMMSEYEGRFSEAVSRALVAAGVPAAYKAAGLTARQLSDMLQATARGLKYGSESRAAFGKGMTVAARALCAPVAGRR